MPPIPIAHTSSEPKIPHHGLSDHAREVARLAADFASTFGASEYARLAALAHDLGKVHRDWQRYVRGELLTTVPHADAGAAALAQNPVLAALALAVIGHHSGLSKFSELRDRLREYASRPRVKETLAEARRLGLWSDPPPHLAIPPLMVEGQHDRFVAEFFVRMLFSALVDADFLDTERYYAGSKAFQRKGEVPEIRSFAPLLNSYLARISHPQKNVVHSARAEILDACRRAALGPPGIYSFTVPTGGGKTLSSLAFALRHAEKYDLRRVIVAVPFTSIIDQTAKTFREIFKKLGSKAVLEHHSAIVPKDEREDRDRNWMDLASENWDAPLIVTTMVQFFESLLGHKPSVCRKLHNIAKSVIIIDEFQALPLPLWDPIISVLNELAAHYGVTVVLSTATQPPTEGFDPKWKLQNTREIISDPSHYFGQLKRVDFVEEGQDSPWTMEQLADSVLAHPQALVVMNTKSQVHNLAQYLKEKMRTEGLYVLTTRLCGKHRLQVIEEIRKRLQEQRPCTLISTQVVEAGVDLDFPVGYRILGPLVSIVQTAGRVNREGRLTQGALHVIYYADDRVPQTGGYRAATDQTRTLLAEGSSDWHSPEFYGRYFRLVMQLIDDSKSREIQQARHSLDYPRVAELFRLIPEDTRPVVVRFGTAEEVAAIDSLVDSARYGFAREVQRRLQPYFVNLHATEYDRHLKEGRILERKVGGEKSTSVLGVWIGKYDGSLLGLVEEDQPAEEYII